MSCECGQADECDGEHEVYYPLQDGGRCSIRPCLRPLTKESNERDDEAWAAYKRDLGIPK